MSSRVLLGAVIGAHGIKGEVKVRSFTQSPENLGAYGPLATEGGRELEIASLRAARGDELIVRFLGIDGRDAAERLKGEGLYVPRSALPEPEKGEYYRTDLVGLRVEDAGGNALGVVAGVHNFGAGGVIEIEGAGGETSFIPFTDAFVIDIAGGRMVAELPRYAEDE